MSSSILGVRVTRLPGLIINKVRTWLSKDLIVLSITWPGLHITTAQ
ncbi:hypothetical protein LINGRAPRIM_LOCUS483 [Linum grandiflorum]